MNQLLERARYLRNHKRYDESKPFVEEALKLDPKNANAVAGLAMEFLLDGDKEQARETARRALELDPNAWEAHRLLGNLMRDAGDMAGAERHYRRAVAANPADSKSRNRLARHLLVCGRPPEEAMEQMLASKRLDPNDPDVQNIWISYALYTGDYERAIRESEIWLAVWAQHIAEMNIDFVRGMLGHAYVGARRPEDAIAQFRAVDPDDDLSVAMALGYTGRISEARAILGAHEKAATAARASGTVTDPSRGAAPWLPELDEKMAMAYVTIGDLDRAFEHLDRQLKARSHPDWVYPALFEPIRRDPRWPAFAARIQREFFRAGESAGNG